MGTGLLHLPEETHLILVSLMAIKLFLFLRPCTRELMSKSCYIMVTTTIRCSAVIDYSTSYRTKGLGKELQVLIQAK
jgi:hypothetical protein